MATEAGERTLLMMRPVRLSMLRYYVLMVVLLAVVVFLQLKPGMLPDYRLLDKYSVIDMLKILLVFVALIAVLTAEVKRIFQAYIVTNMRVIDTHGLIRKATTVMMVRMVERVYTSQTVIQRIFRFGDVIVDTGDDQVVLASVRHPTEVEGAITQAMASFRR